MYLSGRGSYKQHQIDVAVQFTDFQLEKIFSVQDNTSGSPGDSMHNKENCWIVDKITKILNSLNPYRLSCLKIGKNKKQGKMQ